MWKWGLACVLFSVGCGGPGAAAHADKQRLDSKVAQLRAQNRSQRIKLRDMENELFLLRDKLETAEIQRDRAAEPQLRIEVLEPDPEDAVAAFPASGDGYQVVGIDHEGNQIVYVGDAATDRVVRPSLESYGNERPERIARRPLPPIPTVSDRIPTTGHRLPTVESQLRRVRRARSDADGARVQYKRHYAALRARNHASAITGFRAFIAQYPNHDYADNAQYWLGEAYYDQKQYKRAMREFRAVINNYPRGNKVPDALLKVGMCYESLGEKTKARDVFTQVVKIYPTSRPAELAETRLRSQKSPNAGEE